MFSRLEEVSFLFSKIFEINNIESKEIILSTTTGKRIANNAADLLYEQPTANLKEIIEDLRKNGEEEYLKSFSESKLLNAYKQLYEEKEHDRNNLILQFPALSAKDKEKVNEIIQKYKRMWENNLQDRNKQEIIMLKIIGGTKNDAKSL